MVPATTLGALNVLFFVIWKATLKENWNSYLLSIYVIGNSPSGCWNRSTFSAFKAADILNTLESLLDRSFDWLDLIHGINLPQRLKRKLHSHWQLVFSVPFRLLKNKEEIARCQLNSKHGNFFAITLVLLKILSGTSLPMLVTETLKQGNFVVVFISMSASSLYASSTENTYPKLSVILFRVERRFVA